MSPLTTTYRMPIFDLLNYNPDLRYVCYFITSLLKLTVNVITSSKGQILANDKIANASVCHKLL